MSADMREQNSVEKGITFALLVLGLLVASGFALWADIRYIQWAAG